MKNAIIVDAFQFLKTLTFTKLWNGFLLRTSYFLSKISGKIIHWGQPESLSIEPTNLCNLKCPECPSGNNSMLRPHVFLSKDAYYKTINEVYKHISFLQLYFQGEPFLHPSIYEFIKFSCRHGIYTATSTNGQLLTKENCAKIIDSGLHRLIVSVDGITQEVYEQYRVGGSLEKVVEGIKTLAALKKERKRRTPYLIVQFVVFKTNEHQIEAFKKITKEWGIDSLKLKSAQLIDFENGNVLMPVNLKYNRYKKDKNGTYYLNRKPSFKCQRIWNGAVVSAGNELLPCCFDKNASHSNGTLNDKSICDIFYNNTAQNFRKQVWDKKDGLPDICKNCTEGLKKTWF